jgi:hypothetical protein
MAFANGFRWLRINWLAYEWIRSINNGLDGYVSSKLLSNLGWIGWGCVGIYLGRWFDVYGGDTSTLVP